MSIITLTKVSKHYDKFIAVKDISLTINQGEIVAVLGSNGAGKSSTIKMICGLLKPTSGSIVIDGKTYTKEASKIRQIIGYMPEESAMYDDMGLLDYLYFFASLYDVPKSVAKQRIETSLSKLDLPLVNKPICQLSKGMKRKVLLTRSLLADPKILIYDEPASGLDPQTAAFMLTFIKDLKKQKKTILFSSHNLSHVEKIADRVIVIHKGKKIFDDLTSKMKGKVNQTYTVTYELNDKTLQKEVSLHELSSLVHEHILEITPNQSFEDAFLKLIK